jgi:hypothetical protein
MWIISIILLPLNIIISKEKGDRERLGLITYSGYVDMMMYKIVSFEHFKIISLPTSLSWQWPTVQTTCWFPKYI